MKTKFIIFYSVFLLCNSLVKAQSDTITQIKHKNKFISLNAGYGLGWRNNKFHENTIVAYPYMGTFDKKNDVPGNAFNLKIRFGFQKKSIHFSTGLNYCNLNYKNKNATILSTQFTVKYIHRSIGIPISLFLPIGKSKKWKAGGEFSINILFHEFIKGNVPKEFERFQISKQKSNGVNPFIEGTFTVSRRILDISPFRVSIFTLANYTSIVGNYRTFFLSGPNYGIDYKNKHNLLYASVGFEILYKY